MFRPCCVDRAAVWYIPIQRWFKIDSPIRRKLILHTNACTHTPLERSCQIPAIFVWHLLSCHISFVNLPVYRNVQYHTRRKVSRPFFDIKPLICAVAFPNNAVSASFVYNMPLLPKYSQTSEGNIADLSPNTICYQFSLSVTDRLSWACNDVHVP